MNLKMVLAGALLAALAAPVAASAQGVPGGAAYGFYEGGRIAGPVGAIVGTAVGGVAGGVQGVFGVNHNYVSYADEPVRSYRPRKAWRAKAKNSRRMRHAYRSRR
jgi:opacity protein-like surface antigen